MFSSLMVLVLVMVQSIGLVHGQDQIKSDRQPAGFGARGIEVDDTPLTMMDLPLPKSSAWKLLPDLSIQTASDQEVIVAATMKKERFRTITMIMSIQLGIYLLGAIVFYFRVCRIDHEQRKDSWRKILYSEFKGDLRYLSVLDRLPYLEAIAEIETEQRVGTALGAMTLYLFTIVCSAVLGIYVF